MSVMCLSCAGWGCTRCALERAEAAGGEQGLTADELQVQQLRAELAAEQAEHAATLDAVADAVFTYIEERCALVSELAALKATVGSMRKKAFEYRVSQGRHMPPSWSQHFDEIEAEAAAAVGEKPSQYLYGVIHRPRGAP